SDLVFSFTNLYGCSIEWANPSPVADAAAIEVGEREDDDSFTEGDVVDQAVWRLVRRYRSHRGRLSPRVPPVLQLRPADPERGGATLRARALVGPRPVLSA